MRDDESPNAGEHEGRPEPLLTHLSALREELEGFLRRSEPKCVRYIEAHVSAEVRRLHGVSGVYQAGAESVYATMERALSSLLSCRTEDELQAWLTTVFRNALTTKERSIDRERGNGPSSELERLPQYGPGPATEVQGDLDLAGALAALDGHEEHVRVLFRLNTSWGFGRAQLAELMTLPAEAPVDSKRVERKLDALRFALMEFLPGYDLERSKGRKGTGVPARKRFDLDSAAATSAVLDVDEVVLVRLVEWYRFDLHDLALLLFGADGPRQYGEVARRLAAVYGRIADAPPSAAVEV